MVQLEAGQKVLIGVREVRMKQASMVLASLGLGAGALALAAPATAKSIEGWEITVNGENCVMQSTFEDDVTLALVWHPKTGELGFMAAGADWNELVGQRDKPARLELTFDGGVKQPDWIDEGANVVTTVERAGVVGGWGSAHSEQLADAATHATGVAVRVGSRNLGEYNLSGAPAAYRELMRCGKHLVPDQASR